MMNTSASLTTSPTSPSAPMSIGTLDNKNEPDVDAIKMFCGQIPRNMNESELREIFEQFGPVCQLNVLRDKQTGESKGCCFVTYYTRKAALDAQNALHNLRTLTGSHHPIQMKPADTENRNERKLFVGMISKNFDEQSIRTLFQSYGSIEDCTVLRDANGKSRGCAFITFQKRQCAINAIKSMHQSQTMDGCSSPLVVKFADTPKDKETKKVQHHFPNYNSVLMPPINPANSMSNPQAMNAYNFMPELNNLVFLQQLLKNYGLIGNNTNAINYPALNNLLQMFTNSMNLNGNKLPILVPSNSSPSQHGNNQSVDIQEQQQHTGSSPRSPLSSNSNNTSYNTDSSLLMCGPNGNTPQNTHLNPNSSLPTTNTAPYLPAMSPLYPNNANALSNASADAHHNLQNLVAMSQVNNGGLLPTTNSPGAASASFPVFPSSYFSAQVAGKHTEGPDGANLFIYHLPQECNDNDLAQAFSPFGLIISAKVFVDKTTNRSKCFGFVSYDNPTSAQAAISHMNGFQIGTKRLKVQLKKHRNESNP
ncbi:unnamed protein product, partial [Adineta ricciae]